jgi:hypothetical protein
VRVVASPSAREPEVRIADMGAPGGVREELLTPEHCSVLDAFVRFRGPEGTGSARFDCEAAGGRLAGAVSFSCGATFEPNDKLKGQIRARAPEIGSWTFSANRCNADSSSVDLWDTRDPHILVSFERAGVDTSIASGGERSRMTVHYIDLSATGSAVGPLKLDSTQCYELRFNIHESGFVRINHKGSFFYRGEVTVDCPTPRGGRIAGTIAFSEC